MTTSGVSLKLRGRVVLSSHPVIIPLVAREWLLGKRERMLPLILCVAFLASLANALVDLPMRARGGSLHKKLTEEKEFSDRSQGVVSNSTPNFFQQLIWHNDSSRGTFKQRYYFDTTSWSGQSSSPVFLYIGGEGPLGGTSGGYPAVLAKQYNALQFALEHRYYGDSFPSTLLDKDTLQTLNVDTALMDLAAFITAMKSAWGLTGKWMVIGGSYPGALSSWFRQMYPELADLSWSSSGVVNAVYNYTAFDQQVLLDVDPVCQASLHAVTAAFDAAWDDPATRPALLSKFGTPTYFTKGDMAWMLADSAAMACQYGSKASLCAAMVPLSSDPLGQFAAFTAAHYGPTFGASCYYSTACLSDPSMADQWIGADWQWVRQCCTEVAYWQVAYPGSQRSSAITLDYYNAQCRSAFGFDPSLTNPAFNAKYGGAAPPSNHTMALGGSDDPWLRASVQSSLREDYPEFTAECNGCGHCGDLSAGEKAPAITAQHAFIATYVAAWLA